jgi:two-component system sensor histidine kinase ComP
VNKKRAVKVGLILLNIALVFLFGSYLPGIVRHQVLGVSLEKTGNYWTVVRSAPFDAGYQLGIREGDEVLAIDQRNPAQFPSVKRWNEIEGASLIDIRRGETVYTLRIDPYPAIQTIVLDFSEIVIGLIFIVAGFFAWMKQPYSRRVRGLLALNWLLGVVFILAPASARGMFLAKELFLISLSLTPLFLIRFFSFFRRDTAGKFFHFSARFLLILPSVLIVGLCFRWLGAPVAAGALRTLVLVNLLTGSLLALAHLLYAIRVPADLVRRNQLLLMAVGLFAGLAPFLLLNALPLLWQGESWLSPRLTELFVVVLPLSMLYAILNRSLPSAPKLLKTLACFFSAAVILNFLMLFVWPHKQEYPNLVSLYFWLLAFSLSLVFLARGLTILLEKVFKNLYIVLRPAQDQTAGSYAAVRTETEADILEELSAEWELEGVFAIMERAGGVRRQEAVGRFLERQGERQLLEACYAERKSTLATGVGQVLPRHYPAESFLFFATATEQCGLFLGYACSQIRFNPADLPQRTDIGRQIFQRLIACGEQRSLREELRQTRALFEKSQQQNHWGLMIKRRLLSNLEREKESVAREIHDGPLQISCSLSRKIAEIEQGGKDQTERVTAAKELAADLAYELRGLCSALRPPPFNEVGLIPALEVFLADTMKEEFITISLEIRRIERTQRFSDETELAVYRFLQEGVRNAVKHSGSSRAEITLGVSERGLEITLKDFGRGFEPAAILDHSAENKSFGMMGMRERIESLGGQFSVHSTLGQGTTLEGNIPLEVIYER